MDESILTSIKKLLGISEEYVNFDKDIIAHINTTFLTLKQLGVGPEKGFMIVDKKDTWGDFLEDDEKLIAVQTYIYLKVKLVFDPPLNSSVMEANKQSIAELEWRLNVEAES